MGDELSSPEIRIVYCGPALSGKATSMDRVRVRLGAQPDGSIDVSRAHWWGLRCATSDLTLVVRGRVGAIPDIERQLREIARADAVVLVADSQRARRNANEEWLGFIAQAFARRGRAAPVALQCNKRDLASDPSVAGDLDPIERMASLIAPWGGGVFASIATLGEGVWEPFVEVATRAAHERGLAPQLARLLSR